MKTIFNIGLETNTGKKLSLSKAISEVERIMNVYRLALKESDTEPTLIIETYSNVSKSNIVSMANNLEQDCIAVKFGDEGKLVYGTNPMNDWGEFNNDYFLNIC